MEKIMENIFKQVDEALERINDEEEIIESLGYTKVLIAKCEKYMSVTTDALDKLPKQDYEYLEMVIDRVNADVVGSIDDLQKVVDKLEFRLFQLRKEKGKN